MKRSEMVMCLGLISEIYEKFKPTESAVDIWYSLCSEYTLDVFKQGIMNYLKISPYPPSPANIIEQLPKPRTMTGMEAFAIVEKAIGRYGMNNTEAAIQSFPDAIAKAIGGPSGFRSLCLSMETERSTYRAHFLKSYDAIASRDKYIGIVASSDRTLLD